MFGSESIKNLDELASDDCKDIELIVGKHKVLINWLKRVLLFFLCEISF